MYPIVKTYEVFHHHGLMKNPERAAATATVNAITLGTGEAISLPFTAAERLVGISKHHYFVVTYDDAGQMTGWKEISRADFIPP